MRAYLLLALILSSMLPAPTWGQALSPEVALSRMQPAEGLTAQLVASEPLIRQPVTISFDSRGRLWVIQYLQYPTPAGLQAKEVDQFLRTRYDRKPEPPPKGPRGLDRVTILSDPDKQGRYRKSKDFITGLNLASGLALGNDGVYVLQAPYLLFYADRNGDDVPDGDPEVLLDGFGLEDAHAVGNSLTWGPDGWLYGAQGSTVTANIRDPLTGKPFEFQQGVWRYHPRTKQFELFAEGGGNTWGLDFDRFGQVIAGTNWGGAAALHMVQGGFYVKGFVKHGPLHNPHTYGYLEHMPCANFRGGHVTCGGIIYQGNDLPVRFHDKYLACNLLDNNLYWYSLTTKGSSFTMKHEGTLLAGNDPWFRPIDLQTGPDGSLYIVDWYDKRANHVDPVDNWDKTNGRIYRLASKSNQQTEMKDLKTLSSFELLSLLTHDNSWQRCEARRVLSERQDRNAIETLQQKVRAREQITLDQLGVLYGSGGLTPELATQLLQHPQAEIRTWSVRLVTDHATPEGMKTFESLLPQLVKLAQRETSLSVQAQLAITARRTIPGTKSTQWCYAIISELTKHHGPFDDSQLPLLIWWAVEAAITFDDASFASSSLQLPGSNPLHAFLAERIARRLLASESSTSMSALEQLLQVWPNHRSQLLQGMELALAGERLKHAPLAIIKQLRTSSIPTMRELPLLIRLGDPLASKTGYAILEQGSGSEMIRAPILQALSDGEPISSELLLRLFTDAQTDPFRNTILNALASRMNPNVVQSLLSQYSKSSKAVRNQLLAMLLARRESAILLCQAIEGNQVPSKDLSLDQVQQLAHLGDSNIDTMVRKHWGSIKPQTTGEKRARINSVLHMLNQRAGDPTKGLSLFTQHCASCHQLFGSGGKIGPDLTTADRQRNFLATHIVDPNLMIRPEYAAQTIITTDGRTLTGLLIDQNANTLTLVDAQTNRTVLNRTQIDIMQPAKQSLMPEKLLDPLDDDQIRHLFAYLQLPVEAGLKYQHSELSFRAEQIKEPVKFDFADKMLTGMEQFLDAELAASPGKREVLWKTGLEASQNEDAFFDTRRKQFQQLIGAVERRPAVPELQYIASPTQPARIGQSAAFTIDVVRWRAFGSVWAEGLLLEPTSVIKAQVVAIPDADETPEQLAGIVPGIPESRQLARRLAEQGCRVLVPSLVDRSDTYSGVPGIRMTNQPHREWIYRQAFEMGRHIIGYEVLMVRAGIDWLTQGNSLPVGLTGYGEGGLIAFFTGAIDERVKSTLVDGYFSKRETVWKEPIYRNVWGQLKMFGDAEIARLYTIRQLVINQTETPAVFGPPKPRDGRTGAAPGELLHLNAGNEWDRFQRMRPRFLSSQLQEVDTRVKLDTFLRGLGIDEINHKNSAIQVEKHLPNPFQRMERIVGYYSDHTQQLFRRSEAVRKRDSNTIAGSDIQQPRQIKERLKQKFEHDVIGKIDRPLSPAQPRARLLYDQPTYKAYEVELDVFAPHVIAYGWLLIPKDIKPGEKRPVVVCQHGLDGRPADCADPTINNKFYNQFACRLAERGFIVFAPQNPYIFGDRFRLIQRRANPLGLSLFSFIIAQHRQITDWLASLPFVDGECIGFYGLSYGGKTAMRVPAVVPRYCLSICSADFNEWIWKNVSIDNGYTYMLTGEWEMPEWNLGHTFNYAAMAALIAPRPFMVERGHRDGVAPDEQVAYEYAKVRRHYADLKIPDRTAIEFFDGPHSINGKGTFDFLHRHLRWPAPINKD